MTLRRTGAFDGFDFEGFWDEHEFSQKYHEPAPSAELIAEVEREIGYRLPDAYVELAELHNGGLVERSCFPTDEATGWAEDHIEITGIYAIGYTARYSLLGELGSTFMREEWGYPAWGVGVANTPSAGHEQIMLDYRECGPVGEPTVVHVAEGNNHSVTLVAPDFASFVRGLVSEDEFDDSEEELAEALATVRHGTFSPIVQRALTTATDELPDGESLLRALGERIVNAKGGFVLHGDPDSWLMYDAAFWLYSRLATAASFEDYFDPAREQGDYEHLCHVLMLRLGLPAAPYGFNTGGYAPGFVRDWWDARLERDEIVPVDGGYRFTEAFAAEVPGRLRNPTL